MNGFECKTHTALADAGQSSLAHAHATGLNFSARAQSHGLHESLNFHSHSSHLAVINLETDFDPSNDVRSLAVADSNQLEADSLGLNQLTWVAQNGAISLTADSLAQPTRQWLDFATPDSTIAPLASAPQAIQPTIQLVGGTLGADTFTVLPGFQYSVFAGNGNVDFGKGGRDVIDLSGVLSTSVTFNLATATRGGVIFNPGNGAQVFDAISFSNGSQILFEGIDQVRFADGILNLAVMPNDPGFSQQWNLQMMDVQSAWRFTTGSSNILIGIEDSGLGVDLSGKLHPDLRAANTYVYGNNYQDNYLDGTTSHGTDVQGIIAAASNNGIGMSGINWRSDVLHVDVFGPDRQTWSLARASQTMINTASQTKQNLVINMSLGFPGSAGRTDLDPAFEQVVASNPNTLFVVASGNENIYGISYPSSLAQKYNNVIAVGASWGTQDTNGVPKAPGTRIAYPGWWGSNYGNGLTVMGPSEVIATNATLSTSGVQFGYDLKFNGTSAATPNVTGVASLIWSANPNLTAGQVKGILSQTSYDLGAQGYDQVYGNGFVNADSAVRRAMAIGAGAA